VQTLDKEVLQVQSSGFPANHFEVQPTNRLLSVALVTNFRFILSLALLAKVTPVEETNWYNLKFARVSKMVFTKW